MKDIITKYYTIKKRTFTARFETDPIKKAKLNENTLTCDFLPEIKYQLVCYFTEFLFATLKECYEQIDWFRQNGIPVE